MQITDVWEQNKFKAVISGRWNKNNYKIQLAMGHWPGGNTYLLPPTPHPRVFLKNIHFDMTFMSFSLASFN